MPPANKGGERLQEERPPKQPDAVATGEMDLLATAIQLGLFIGTQKPGILLGPSLVVNLTRGGPLTPWGLNESTPPKGPWIQVEVLRQGFTMSQRECAHLNQWDLERS